MTCMVVDYKIILVSCL